MLDDGLLGINGASESKLFENAVFNALYRKEEVELAYYSDQSMEVDFVVSAKGAVRALIQASYDISDFTTKERELKALVSTSNKLKCKNLYVVTLNSAGVEYYKGKKIVVLPLWKFMLNKSL